MEKEVENARTSRTTRKKKHLKTEEGQLAPHLWLANHVQVRPRTDTVRWPQP